MTTPKRGFYLKLLVKVLYHTCGTRLLKLYYSIHFGGCTKAEGSFILRITEQPSALVADKTNKCERMGE
jgi:hypothetical protein